MFIEFENNNLSDNLIITPENNEERELLRQWDDRVVWTEYYLTGRSLPHPEYLQIIRER